MLDATNISHSLSPSQPPPKKHTVAGTSVNARLLALAGQAPTATPPQISQNNGINHQSKPIPAVVVDKRSNSTQPPLPTSFTTGQFNAFGPKTNTSNPSTPNSMVSPSPVAPPVVEMSPSIRSLANTGFTVAAAINPNSNDTSLKEDEEGTRNSYSPANSPGMASPGNYERDGTLFLYFYFY